MMRGFLFKPINVFRLFLNALDFAARSETRAGIIRSASSGRPTGIGWRSRPHRRQRSRSQIVRSHRRHAAARASHRRRRAGN